MHRRRYTTFPARLATAAGLTVALAALLPSARALQDAGAVTPSQVPVVERSDVQSFEATRSALDRQFIIGPSRLDSLRLRSVWQSSLPLPQGVSLKRIFVPDGDSAFALDSGNGITRLRTDSGARIWRDVVGSPKDTIFGLERAKTRTGDVTLVTSDVEVIVLETGNGIRTGTQRLEKYPSTGSIRSGNYLIYGTRTGLVTWQQFVVGHGWRSSSLGGSIKADPVLTPSGIVAGSTSGIISLLEPGSAGSMWRFKAGGAIEGRLATDGKRAFAAATDQYVYAVDMARGRAAWKFLSDAPLGADVACVGDGVYVQVRGKGMLALAADGGGKLDGTVRWRAPIAGLPIAMTGAGVVAWDRASSTYTLFDPATGAVRVSEVLDGVADVRVSGGADPTFYFVAADGRVQQARPVDAMPSQPQGVATAATVPGT